MEFPNGFKEKLDATHQWPSPYLFKFVVPETKKADLLSLVPTGLIEERWSKNGRFVSITIKTQMSSADEVIKIYERVAQVEGIISL